MSKTNRGHKRKGMDAGGQDVSVVDAMATNDDIRSKVEQHLRGLLVARAAGARNERLLELVGTIRIEALARRRKWPLARLVELELKREVQDADAELRNAFHNLLSTLRGKETLGDLLELDKPLREARLFKEAAIESDFESILDLTALARGDKREAFLKLQDQRLPEAKLWTAVVSQKLLTKAEAAHAQFVLELGRITSNSAAVVKQLLARKVSTTRALATWTALDWQKNVLVDGIRAPAAFASLQKYAAFLEESIATRHPTIVFMDRLSKARSSLDAAAVERLDQVLAANPTLSLTKRLPVRGIRWGKIRARAATQNDAETVRRLILLHPELSLDDVLHDRGLSPDKRVATMRQRIERHQEGLKRFLERNPDFDLRLADIVLDTSGDQAKKIDWTGINEEHRPPLRKALLRYQRLFRLHPRAPGASELMEAGLDSARAIVRRSESRFVRDFSDAMGGETAARLSYRRALGMTQKATLHAANLRATVAPAYQRAPFNNLPSPAATTASYAMMAGYQEMFGGLEFCACDHCNSIFSPAAYLVDLHRFIDTHLDDAALLGRRSDIDDIELTCENTNDEVSYLDLVLEVLQGAIAGSQPYRYALAPALHPFSLPFVLPLAEIDVYLERLQVAPNDWLDAFGKTAAESARAYFRLSRESAAILAETGATSARLKARYGRDHFAGVSFTDADLGYLFVLDLFRLHCDLSRAEVEELFVQHLSDDELALGLNANFYVNAGEAAVLSITKGTAAQDYTLQKLPSIAIGDEYEKIGGLSKAKLDRIDRFIRLSRTLGWTFTDLDWVLRSLSVGDTIDDAALANLALIHQWQKRFGIGIDVLVGLWSTLKNFGRRGARKAEANDLFSRVFNPKGVDQNPIGAPFFDLAAPKTLVLGSSTTAANRAIRLRLLAALNVSEEELLRIEAHVRALQVAGGIAAPGSLVLSLANLSLLYRLTTVPKVLGLGVREFLLLLLLAKAVGELAAADIRSVNDLEVVIEHADWITSSAINLYDLAYIVDGNASEYSPPAFATDTLKPVTEVLMNEGSVLSGLQPQLNAAELGDRKLRIATERLSELLEVPAEHFAALARSAGVSLNDGTLLDDLFSAIGAFTDPVPASIASFVGTIQRRKWIAQRLKLDADDLVAISAYPAAFGVADPTALTLVDIRALARLRAITSSVGDTNGSIRKYLILKAEGTSTTSTLTDALAGATSWPRSEIVTYLSAENVDTVHALHDMRRRFEVARTVGVAVATLKDWTDKMVLTTGTPSEQWTRRTDLAKAVLEALKGKYEGEKWGEAYGHIQDELRERKRDALAQYLIWDLHPKTPAVFDQNDLYQYFLLDVAMSACAKTSRVKAAVGSLQLYVHRCLSRLEQDTDVSEEARTEWAWMKNYRVWEANRKVFLYPENYIVPELRDDKTELFVALEKELLQGELTRQHVEQAYRRYLAGFAELANLKTVGTYRHPETGTIYVVGRSRTDPFQYYHRRFELDRWTLWEKIALGIRSEYASPIFAMGRLWLFWIDLKSDNATKSIAGGTASADEERSGTISYSFLDANGRWFKPQNLGTVGPHAVRSSSGPIDDPARPFWRRVFPHVFKNDPASSAFQERPGIFLIYGGYLIPAYGVIGSRWLRLYPRLQVDQGGVGGYEPGCTVENLFVDDSSVEPSLTSGKTTRDVHNTRAMSFERSFPDKFTPMDTLLGQDRGHGIEVLSVDDSTAHYVVDLGDEEFLVRWRKRPMASGPKVATEVVLNLVNVSATKGSVYASIVGKYLEDGIHLDKLLEPESTAWQLDTFDVYEFTRLTTHPALALSRRLEDGGLDELLTVQAQVERELDFDELTPGASVEPPWQGTQLHFDGPYGIYYREIFFFAPALIAERLRADGRFEEAQSWYHRIYDPLIGRPEYNPDGSFELVADRDVPWRYLPFRNRTPPSLCQMLDDTLAADALAAYRRDPFNPHAIARLRQGAYQKNIVMRYIDNLLDWGDQLYERYTWESLNEATMLYVLAFNLLGPKPEELGVCKSSEATDLRSVALRDAEFLISLESDPCFADPMIGTRALNDLLYFCVPENEVFLKYWDRVRDRLDKIRHCRTIAGAAKGLDLWERELDPTAIVRAVAARRDLSSVVADLEGARTILPVHRFSVSLAQAKAAVGTVQQLGASLLAALEKEDAAELERLRAVQHSEALEMMEGIRSIQLREVEATLEGLREAEKGALARRDHFTQLLAKGLSSHERTHLTSMMLGWYFSTVSNMMRMSGGVAHLVPNAGAPTSLNYGGREVGSSLRGFGEAFDILGSLTNLIGSMSERTGSYQRRAEEWSLQLKNATSEAAQLRQQIVAAERRVASAEREIEAQQQALRHTEDVQRFLESRFTNRELYGWHVTQLAGLYFQSYRLAYEYAKGAERAFQFELDNQTTYVQYGHWDNLRRGLLAGEQLILQLQRLERAYLDRSDRDLEIVRNFSLAQLAPGALVDLRQDGACEFSFSQRLYDFDFPGHFRRKIRSVSVSIPAVVGPYQDIHATLRQLKSLVHLSEDSTVIDDHADLGLVEVAGSELVRNMGLWNRQEPAIAVSRGVDDAGVHLLNFGDDRYLPFEGTGAVSRWRLEMPKASNPFDFDTIRDVIVTVRYHAKFHSALQQDVKARLTQREGVRLLSLRHEASDAYQAFLTPRAGAKEHELKFEISRDTFPANLSEPTLSGAELGLELASGGVKMKVVDGAGTSVTKAFAESGTLPLGGVTAFGSWRLTVDRSEIPVPLRRKGDDGAVLTETIDGRTHYFLDRDAIANIGLVLQYAGRVSW